MRKSVSGLAAPLPTLSRNGPSLPEAWRLLGGVGMGEGLHMVAGLYIVAAVVVTLLSAWLALSRRPGTLDVDPVSPHWLAENKRSGNDHA